MPRRRGGQGGCEVRVLSGRPLSRINSDPHRLQRRATFRRGALTRAAYGGEEPRQRTPSFLRCADLDAPSASECLLCRSGHRCPASAVSGGRWPSQGSAGAPQRRLGCPRLAGDFLSRAGIAGTYGRPVPRRQGRPLRPGPRRAGRDIPLGVDELPHPRDGENDPDDAANAERGRKPGHFLDCKPRLGAPGRGTDPHGQVEAAAKAEQGPLRRPLLGRVPGRSRLRRARALALAD
jgi:hypothetical protein